MTGFAAGYLVRVGAHLDPHWSCWFGDLSLTHEADGTTSIRIVADQAALFGLLMKLRDLGVALLSVQLMAGDGDRQPLGAEMR